MSQWCIRLEERALRHSYHTLITFGFAARTHTLVACIYVCILLSSFLFFFFLFLRRFVKNFWHGLPTGDTTGLRNYYGILRSCSNNRNTSTNASRVFRHAYRPVSTGNKFILNLSEYCTALFSASFRLLKVERREIVIESRDVALDEFAIVVSLYLKRELHDELPSSCRKTGYCYTRTTNCASR